MTDNPVPYMNSPDPLQTVINHLEHPTLVIDRKYRVIMSNHKLLGIARKINAGKPLPFVMK